MNTFFEFIVTDYAQGLILPSKNGANVNPASTTRSGAALDRTTNKAFHTADGIKEPKDLSNRDLSITDEFFCTPDDLYRVLTTKEVPSSLCSYSKNHIGCRVAPIRYMGKMSQLSLNFKMANLFLKQIVLLTGHSALRA